MMKDVLTIDKGFAEGKWRLLSNGEWIRQLGNDEECWINEDNEAYAMFKIEATDGFATFVVKLD